MGSSAWAETGFCRRDASRRAGARAVARQPRLELASEPSASGDAAWCEVANQVTAIQIDETSLETFAPIN